MCFAISGLNIMCLVISQFVFFLTVYLVFFLYSFRQMFFIVLTVSSYFISSSPCLSVCLSLWGTHLTNAGDSHLSCI